MFINIKKIDWSYTPHLVIVFLQLLTLGLYFRLISLPPLLAFSIAFTGCGIIPGLLIVRLIEKDWPTDMLEFAAKSFFFSVVFFTPLSMLAYFFKFRSGLLILGYTLISLSLFFANFHHLRWKKTNPGSIFTQKRYYYVYIILLLVVVILVINLGLLVYYNDDTGEFIGLTRKFAENPTVKPYGFFNDEVITFEYGYNTWLLYISLFPKIADVDVIYSWHLMVGLMLLFAISSTYTFIKYFSGNQKAAVFGSISFFFILYYGYSVPDIVFIYISRGAVVNPSAIIYYFLLLTVLYLAQTIEYKKPVLIGIVVLCISTLLSIHGTGALTFTLFFIIVLASYLFRFRKNLPILKVLFIIGILAALLNFPYLYRTKITNKSSHSYLAENKSKYGDIDQKIKQVREGKKVLRSRFFRDLYKVTDSMYIYKPSVYLKIRNLFHWDYAGLIGLAGLCLMWYCFKNKTRFRLFAAAVFSVPLFLNIPFFVTYGRKFFTINQIYRLGAFSVFIKIAVLLTVYLFFDYLGKRLEKWRPLFSAIPFILLAIILATHIGTVMEIYKKNQKNSPYFWAKLLESDYVKILQKEVPPGTKILNLSRGVDTALLSSSYITFAQFHDCIKYSPSYKSGQKTWQDHNDFIRFLRKNQLDRFMKKLAEYPNNQYIQLGRGQREILTAYEPFTKEYGEMTSLNGFYLYRRRDNGSR